MSGETVRSRSEKAWRAPNEPLIHDSDLQEILCQRSGLKIIIVGLADSSQEAHRSGPTKFIVQHRKHKSLRLENLFCGITIVDHVHNLVNRRAVDLLILGGDKQRCSPDKLKLSEGDNLGREETIDIVGGEEESLGEKVKPSMNLDEPVHENRAH